MYNPFKPQTPGNVVYWRHPTPGEVKFGYGAIHYAEFSREECQKPDGTLKRWIKARDGLRYNLPR